LATKQVIPAVLRFREHFSPPTVAAESTLSTNAVAELTWNIDLEGSFDDDVEA